MATDTPNTDTTPPAESRSIWWVFVVISLAAILIAGISLTKRIGAYYEREDNPLFA